MAKKEKKEKAKKQPRQNKQAPLIPEHQRPLICPPDQAGRGLATRVFGYVCRCLVVMCLTWALMMFFGGGIAFPMEYDGVVPDVLYVGVSDFSMLLLAAFATATLGLICYNRYTALGGVALGAAGIALLSPNVVQGVLALYNGFLCRLYMSKFTLYLPNLGVGVPNIISASDLAQHFNALLSQYGKDGMLVMALVLSAIFVPLIAKRTRPVLPTIACVVVIVPVCVFNTATSGLGAGMLISSIAAVLVMWAYDKLFRRKINADKYDTKLQLFREQGKPQYPEEYLQKLRAKAEKKQQKKLARQAKKQKRRKDKTVDEEISDYFKQPKKKVKVKAKKARLTAQEKKALRLQKKEQRLHKKQVRKQIRQVRRYEQVTDGAKSAMGGFAAAMMLAVCLVIVILPSLTVNSRMVIKLLDDKISYARSYVTAALMGDDERLNELEYELNPENFEPHSTELKHMEFQNVQLFRVETNYGINMYLRGWIGVDYNDGAWYTGQKSKDPEQTGVFEAYRDLFGTDENPSEQMFYDFYWLIHKDDQLKIFDPEYDFQTKIKNYSDYGFVAAKVNIHRINSYSSLVYLPNVFDQSRGLQGFGNAEASEHTFINYFDGVLTGRDFSKGGTEYSAVTFLPIKTDKDWIGTLGTDIANYNLQKELILAYQSYEIDSLTNRPRTSYKAVVLEDTPEKGYTTITYTVGTGDRKVTLGSFVHRSEDVTYVKDSQNRRITLRDAQGATYIIELDDSFKVESVTTENTDSLFHRYISGKDSDKREIERILFNGDPKEDTDYTEYVYTYYTGKSDSKIIADMATHIFNNATYKEKVPVGTEIIEPDMHEEYHVVDAVADIDWENQGSYFIKETSVDQNGEEIVNFVPATTLTDTMVWAGMVYKKTMVPDGPAEEITIYEVREFPYDFSAATAQGATFEEATVQRNDLVKAVIDYIIDDLGCTYTLTPNLENVDPELDGVENFLTVTNEGYCVQFASAVCLILREYGIPARYVEGYIACGFDSNHRSDRVGTSISVVYDYEAHAWVEVFFDGIGWVQYECTPAYYEGMYGGSGSSGSENNSSTPKPPSIKDEVNDMISKEEELEQEEELNKEELEEAEQRKQLMIVCGILLAVLGVVGGVIWLIVYLRGRAASAEYKRSSAVETVLADHFGQNTSEDDRRELSYTVIDALHNLLDIYGLAPETGEFKDEYARRVATDLEDILGRSPEYESDQAEPDPNAPAPLPISPHRMGQIMDGIAAEEFGHGMTIAQMKQVAALYKDLRAAVHKRVPFVHRLILRYIKNRL